MPAVMARAAMLGACHFDRRPPQRGGASELRASDRAWERLARWADGGMKWKGELLRRVTGLPGPTRCAGAPPSLEERLGLRPGWCWACTWQGRAHGADRSTDCVRETPVGPGQRSLPGDPRLPARRGLDDSCSSIAVSFSRRNFSSSSCTFSPGARNHEAMKPVKVPKRLTPAVTVSANEWCLLP